MPVNPPCFPYFEMSSTARGLSTSVLTSLVAAAGKIPDHHHGARHSICYANGRGGGWRWGCWWEGVLSILWMGTAGWCWWRLFLHAGVTMTAVPLTANSNYTRYSPAWVNATVPRPASCDSEPPHTATCIKYDIQTRHKPLCNLPNVSCFCIHSHTLHVLTQKGSVWHALAPYLHINSAWGFM